MAIFQPDTNLMTQLQGYRSQRGLTSGQRLSTPEWRGIVEGYNSSQYRNALEMAKIAEQRRQQAMALQTQKDLMDQRMQGSELKGAGQLGGGLYSGYKMGQDVGLWGNKQPTGPTQGLSVSPEQSNYAPGPYAPPAPVEATTPLAASGVEGISPLAAAPDIASPMGALAGTGFGVGEAGSMGGILGGSTEGVGVLAPSVVEGMGMLGPEVAAEGIASAAPAAAGSSVAGPIGMGVGGAMLLASLLGFGPEEWF